MLKLVLAILFVIIWGLVVYAPSLPYDDNYASLLSGMLWSLIATIGLGLLFVFRRAMFMDNKIAIILFLLTSNPVTVFFVFIEFSWLIGPMAT